MDTRQFIDSSGNVNTYRVIKVLPDGNWKPGDKVQNGTLYDQGYNILKLVENGYIRSITEPMNWQRILVGENEHSVHCVCGMCGHWFIPFPLENKCPECNYQKCLTYYDAETIDKLLLLMGAGVKKPVTPSAKLGEEVKNVP